MYPGLQGRNAARSRLSNQYRVVIHTHGEEAGAMQPAHEVVRCCPTLGKFTCCVLCSMLACVRRAAGQRWELAVPCVAQAGNNKRPRTWRRAEATQPCLGRAWGCVARAAIPIDRYAVAGGLGTCVCRSRSRSRDRGRGRSQHCSRPATWSGDSVTQACRGLRRQHAARPVQASGPRRARIAACLR